MANDRLYGNKGRDRFITRDKRRDVIRGGIGRDLVRADSTDTVFSAKPRNGRPVLQYLRGLTASAAAAIERCWHQAQFYAAATSGQEPRRFARGIKNGAQGRNEAGGLGGRSTELRLTLPTRDNLRPLIHPGTFRSQIQRGGSGQCDQGRGAGPPFPPIVLGESRAR